MDNYTFRIKIEKIVEQIRAMKSSMSKEEIAIMGMLYTNWKSDNPEKITQAQFARDARWLGSHPKHEKHREETTLRKVRQVIRDLRIKYNAPILSDLKGYFIPKTQSQVEEYLHRIEIEAKAQTAAWFETYTVMDKIFGMKSKFFDAQKKLFEPEQLNLYENQ